MTTKLRMKFWNDDEAIFLGKTFEDVLRKDIHDILTEAKGYCTISDMVSALRKSNNSNYSSQFNKHHGWSIDSTDANYIDDIAESLGFEIGPALHHKTKKPLKHKRAIYLN